MQLTNKFANNIVNVAPVLNPSVGAPVIYVAGPNPASPNGPVPSGGGTFNFTWTYQISAGAPGQTFTFVGSANGTEQTAPYPPGTPRATGNSTTAAIQVGGYTVTLNPTTGTNAKSAYEELIWSFTNQGCTPTNSVSIAGSIPAGWTWTGGDSYSLVNGLESWTVGGANPPVVFTATGPVDQLPTFQSSEYHLVYPLTPAATGVYTFNVSITDTSAHTEIIPTAITVNSYDPGDPAGLNGTGTGVWHEDVK